MPKVVTTPDLLSVIEAIESSLYGEDRYEEKLEDVKLFFESMSCGAEAVGFNLTGERLWVERLFATYPSPSKKPCISPGFQPVFPPPLCAVRRI